ncbi:Succinate dehydrogenase subunit 3-2, mitochondrial [Mucuna pruriens]|uniref:Succinate dehydrogenase subunit 3-2, mitochondrial n=1 Tax=Mucuna pruriens TaxID=157652 RepID=A0A371HWQ3_MUCPR|nr:Succinate dehydrogenase subunit 3-2, mitochondrial [Mucuna pruriens]
MSRLLRSTKAKLISSSLSRTFPSLSRPNHDLPQIGTLSPLPDLFHRNTATMPLAKENAAGRNLTGLPRDPANKLGTNSNAISSSMYKASGLDISVLAGARYGTKVWAAQGPMLLGVNTVMARSFERGMEAGTLGMIGHKRFMSDSPSKTSETNPSGFRPLSPHLPIYQPQLSSTLSICNRIAGAFLAGVILLFYMIYMKVGLVSLTYDSFYQFIFYSSKLNLLVMEISALAVSYHLYSAIRHLFL